MCLSTRNKRCVVGVSLTARASNRRADLEQRMFKDEVTRPAVMMVSDEDGPLVLASHAGDGAAFEQLVSRYDRKLFRIAYHIVRNADDAQDVVQDSFIKASKILGSFKHNQSFRLGFIGLLSTSP